MTSLQLLPKEAYHAQGIEPTEWGTGQQKLKVPLWTPRPPTWHLSGRPTSQFYRLTQLKKSNVRMNDQLLPKPQECDISQDFIEKPFPSNHPYSSHINKFSVFPSFATTPEDPTRGMEARNSQPLSAETPARPFDVQIVSKIKGFGRRHEIQSLPSEGLKRGLSWCGEKDFDQLVKSKGGRQKFYPHPTKQVVPNLVSRSADQALSPSTANATRNIERLHWHSTYGREFSGLGPNNPYKLDNMAEKVALKQRTGEEDDELKPTHMNTFDPARPFEGRISDEMRENKVLTLEGAKQYDDPDYFRKLTLTEREEDRLWNGGRYTNLPEQSFERTEEPFRRLIEQQTQRMNLDTPYAPPRTGDIKTETNYMNSLREQERERIQQIEAQNRWKLLEAQQPSHDLRLLSKKVVLSMKEEQPATFYGHEGRYNEERAGLYKTSYEPGRLANSMANPPNAMFDTSYHGDSHAVEVELDPALACSKTYPPNLIPQLSDRPSTYEVFGSYLRDRHIRERLLLPNATTARAEVQDGPEIQNITTQGDGYNTPKFLSEYKLSKSCRVEPMALMSTENQDLNNVRMNSIPRKAVSFAETVSLAPSDSSVPLRVSQAHIENPQVELTSPRTPRQNGYQTPLPGAALQRRSSFDVMTSPSAQGRPITSASPFMGTLAPNGRTSMSAPNAFRSQSTNFMPHVEHDFMFKNGENDRTEFDLNYKSDNRLKWTPESGSPRPQTSLLKIQNKFTKTKAHAQLHGRFRETNPNLIQNIHTGKKHDFGLNAQVLRGAAA